MNETQFAGYLFQGLGRPHLFARQHDITPYRDAVLYACLYAPMYDRQCEGSRTQYLFSLIQHTAEPDWFRDRILEALADPDEQMYLEHLFDFARIYSQRGDRRARQLMYERFAEIGRTGNTIGATQLIDLDGIDGFLFVAQQLGEAAHTDSLGWEAKYLPEYLIETIGEEQGKAFLREANDVHPFVRTYLDMVTAAQHQREHMRHQRVTLSGKSYSEVRTYLLNAQGRYSFPQLRQWGEHATPADSMQAAHDLLHTTDIPLLSAYLTIFARRAFPLDYHRLFPLTQHSNQRIARWSITALGQIQHPDIRALGLQFIEAHHYIADALDIFVTHYQPGDEAYLLKVLDNAADQNEVHTLGFGLYDIFTAHPSVESKDIFLQLYERGPCSLCREKFVERLIALDQIPHWMLEECRYDANDALHTMVRSFIEATPANLHSNDGA